MHGVIATVAGKFGHPLFEKEEAVQIEGCKDVVHQM